MQRRGRQLVVGVLVLAAVQAAAIAIYKAGRRSASSERPTTAFAVETLAPRAAPELVLERSDGARISLAGLAGKPVLVHFWATWCRPCRTELPGLFATATTLERSMPFAFLAISVDDSWEEMRAYFDGRIPPSVVRPETAEVHRLFGAATLPDSYLVDASGRIVQRYSGARDWSTAEARASLASAVEQAARR